MQRTEHLVACTLLACATSLSAQNVWQLTAPPNSGPPAAASPGLAYCVSTNTSILYGGTAGGVTSNQTWQYDGATATWTQLFPTTDPGPRHTFGICYDFVRDVVVVLGGRLDSSSTPYSDTWEYAPLTNTWTNVTPTSGPSPQGRWGCAMTFDILRGVCVLHGGWGGGGVGFVNNTWEWDGTSWTQVLTASVPSPRDRTGFCYDLVRARCVLFGGTGGNSAQTWEYDGVDWTQVTTPTTPPARQDAPMAFDAMRGVCVLQGGRAGGTQRTDSWEYHGLLGNWRFVPTTLMPARNESAITFDFQRGATVVFGGIRGGYPTDTWEYGPANAPSFTVFGVGCAGSNGVPGLAAAANSTPALGTTFDMVFSNLDTAGGVGFLAFGFSDFQMGAQFLPIDLGYLGWTGCTGYVSPDISFAFGHVGMHTASISIPNAAPLQRLTFYVQALMLDAGAPNGVVAASPAGEVVVY